MNSGRIYFPSLKLGLKVSPEKDAKNSWTENAAERELSVTSPRTEALAAAVRVCSCVAARSERHVAVNNHKA